MRSSRFAATRSRTPAKARNASERATDRLGRRSRQDQPADERRVHARRGPSPRSHPATGRRPRHDRRVACVADRGRQDVGRAVERERFAGPRAVRRAGRSAIVWNSPDSSACWAAHIAPVSRVPWTKTMTARRRADDDDAGRRASGFGHGPRSRPCSTANNAACVRLVRPSLARMFETWVRAVRSAMPSSVGDRLVRQAARDDSARTSRSRAGQPARRSPAGVLSPASAGSLRRIRRATMPATAGSRWTSPACAARMAAARSSASASLSRKPLAPASMRRGDPVLLDEAGDRDDLDRRVARP